VSEWERAKHHIAPALDGWTLEAVESEIEQGRARLWTTENSAAVTQLHEYPAGRVLRLWLAGGDLDELRGLHDSIAERYAREQGCVRIEIEGRPGWERVFQGYRKTRVILTKEV
jgi:hypothetical protein